MRSSALSRVPGLVAGAALAPLTAVGSYLRRSRLFHPRGTLLWGYVTAVPGPASLHEAGARLEGPVLVRFSGAWWKSRQWLDVLGCALRFTAAPEPSTNPRRGDQDLLLATVRNPLTTLLAPLGTRVDDYLRNRYFGVSPFAVEPLGRVKLRLTPAVQFGPPGAGREQRLNAALRKGPIRLTLEARPNRLAARYLPLATLELFERVDLDQEALRFDPFQTGRGLRPVGLVHSMRVASYAASRRARGSARERRRVV